MIDSAAQVGDPEARATFHGGVIPRRTRWEAYRLREMGAPWALVARRTGRLLARRAEEAVEALHIARLLAELRAHADPGPDAWAARHSGPGSCSQKYLSGTRSGIYVVSRASIPERPAMWRRLREAGWPVIATWIDEDTPVDRGELLSRCVREAASAERVIVYVEPGDLPLRIGWVEVGAALSAGTHVFVVAPDVSDATLGHLTMHPLVSRCATVELAMTICGREAGSEGRPGAQPPRRGAAVMITMLPEHVFR
jgi:hypothetical protein